VEVPRDEGRILRKLKLAAITAGEDWFYHIPVPTKRQPGITFVEGPSIKMTSDLARLYGNCVVETHVTDLGDSWIVEARFTDLETGYSLSRPHQHGKPAEARERPSGRALESALQAAISKAMRNVVSTALPSLTDFGLKEARTIVLSGLEADLEPERTRTIGAMAGFVALQDAEALLGHPAELWSAADLHQLRSVLRALKDGILGLGDLTLSRGSSERKSPKSVHGESEALSHFARAAPSHASPEIVLAELPQATKWDATSGRGDVSGRQTKIPPTRPRRRGRDEPPAQLVRKGKTTVPAIADRVAP
jgi:hypothetical protein